MYYMYGIIIDIRQPMTSCCVLHYKCDVVIKFKFLQTQGKYGNLLFKYDGKNNLNDIGASYKLCLERSKYIPSSLL